MFESSFELKDIFDRLFQRPTKLQVVVGEMFPATRDVDAEAASTEMDGVEHLGQYVFEMTQAKIKSLESGNEALPPKEEGTGLDLVEDEDVEGVAEEDGGSAAGDDDLGDEAS